MKVMLLHPRKLLGKVFAKGMHELPEKLMDDWFFKHMLKVGDASVMTPVKEDEAAAPAPAKKPAKS